MESEQHMAEDRANRDIRSYYRARALEYDSNDHKTSDRSARRGDINKARKIVTDTVAGKSVLEVAAGAGFWAQIIAETAKSVTATDIIEDAIELARKRKYYRNNITFRVADMYDLGDLPPHEALFGAFIFSHVLLEDRAKFISAINSYVVPGGTVLLMDNLGVMKPNDSSCDHNNYQLRTLKDGSQYKVVKNYMTKGEFERLLENNSHDLVFKSLEHCWILIYRVPGVMR
jgi:2-polyprenyl-3-methyl-5-hydroxy-6-metoxy-1,4-benzoquinol methylase